jgi:putative endonuclease
VVARWYADAGYEVLARNWRVREGELDVVARSGATIAFCEVKTRRSDAFGIPAEAVTPVKQARIRRLAVQWLADNHERADVLRFDVAAVKPDGRGRWIVDVIEGAF